MTIEKTEFEFPDEVEEKRGRVNASSVIEIVDDTPEGDRNRSPMKEEPKDFADDELAKYDESVKNRIKHFTKGYHEERRAKEAAQREREEAIHAAKVIVEENKKLKGSLSEGQAALLEQAKRVVGEELKTAKQKYKTAYEAGDSEALVDAQEELISAKAKAERVNNFKPTPLQETKFPVQSELEADSAPLHDPKAQAWQQKNLWFGENDEMTSFAFGLHTKLVKSGVDPHSDDYYEKLNSRLRQVFPDEFESEKSDDAYPRRYKSNVAPATRSTAPRKIVLTQTQVNLAKRLNVPLELYARKVAEEMRK